MYKLLEELEITSFQRFLGVKKWILSVINIFLLPFSIDAHGIYIWDPNAIMVVPLVTFATLIQNALQNSV